jgi:hypothetical protein
MVLPKNAGQFSSFFKDAFSLVTCKVLTVFLLLYFADNFSVKKVAKLLGLD